MSLDLAVIIPAYNEEKTIANVVKEYREAVPEAKIYVGDNNSSDETAKEAKKAGATVLTCERQGKGNAVRRMLEAINADIYIMIDADETYSASNIRELLQPVIDGEAEMVVGARKQVSAGAFSFSHKIGNKILTTLLNRIFKVKLKDILSGYRVMSRRLVDTVTLLAKGFEIEAELTIRTLQERFRILEIPIDYRNRPEGSDSKLSTWGDGFLILYTIITLFRDYNPMIFFMIMSLIFFIAGLISGTYILVIYIKSGVMYHIGLAIFTALTIMLSAIIFMLGLLLDSMNNSWRLAQEDMRRDREIMRKLIDANNKRNAN
ncbi:MAG: glycosyltransferase family 2 protein [candidate division KSB1 bacterium]|jgi:glycosyltransferase involved in cell wall biosynthesis|nr:glycosyltransferase family 2 protein [candidate division KSB1 bacterium]